MPHPKNMQKLSGDVHPPELEDETAAAAELDDITMEARAEPDAETFRPNANTPAPAPRFSGRRGSLQAYGDSAREQVRTQPMKSLGAAFALGFVLAAVFR